MSGDHDQYQYQKGKLPPLPKADRVEAVQFCDDAYWFSADQMREYGELCRQQALQSVKVQIPTATMDQEFARYYDRGYASGRQQALEEAAKVCDRYATNSSNPMNFAENCAEAIRSLK